MKTLFKIITAISLMAGAAFASGNVRSLTGENLIMSRDTQVEIDEVYTARPVLRITETIRKHPECDVPSCPIDQDDYEYVVKKFKALAEIFCGKKSKDIKIEEEWSSVYMNGYDRTIFYVVDFSTVCI